MTSPRLLQEKPLLIRHPRDLLPGRDPAPSVPPPVKDLLGSVQVVNVPLDSVPTVKDLPVSVLPVNVPMVKDPLGSVPTVSILPVLPQQPTGRKRSALR